MKSKKILLTILASVASGVIIGMLFAPKKGSKTRKMILQGGEALTDAFKEKLNSISESFAEGYDITLGKADALVENGKVKYDNVVKEIKKVTT